MRWTFDAASTYSDLYDLRVKDAAGAVVWEEDLSRPARFRAARHLGRGTRRVRRARHLCHAVSLCQGDGSARSKAGAGQQVIDFIEAPVRADHPGDLAHTVPHLGVW